MNKVLSVLIGCFLLLATTNTVDAKTSKGPTGPYAKFQKELITLKASLKKESAKKKPNTKKQQKFEDKITEVAAEMAELHEKNKGKYLTKKLVKYQADKVKLEAAQKDTGRIDAKIDKLEADFAKKYSNSLKEKKPKKKKKKKKADEEE